PAGDGRRLLRCDRQLPCGRPADHQRPRTPLPAGPGGTAGRKYPLVLGIDPPGTGPNPSAKPESAARKKVAGDVENRQGAPTQSQTDATKASAGERGTEMTKVVVGMSMSVDGIAGPQVPDADGMVVFNSVLGWVFPLRSWREQQGQEGGEDSVDSRVWAGN